MKHYIHIIVIGLLFVSCSTKREAVGAADEIVVIVSNEDRLSKIFTDTLFTPQPEPIYKLKYADPIGFKELKRQTNLIVGSIGTNELNSGTKLVKSLLGEEIFNETINGDQQIIFSEDQFGRDQLFMIISGKSSDDIDDALLGKSEWIKSNFVWLGREMPYQWFSVHWEDGFIVADSTIAVEYSYRFPQEYYKNIRYNDYKYQMEQVVFNNWTAWKSFGIWESIDEARGGPFINYTWYDGVTDRTYNLNMLVFIPNKNKAMFMRQLDIIAHSFTVK
jgi:hypothetical protein